MRGRPPLSLVALLLPGCSFAAGLLILKDQPRFHWLRQPAAYPWELAVIALSGIAATAAGMADWAYHRSGKAVVGPKEHRGEVAALACGGLPLFALMAAASCRRRPEPLLIPVIVCALFTTVMICYDEFVFHLRRCGGYETSLHRLLVFGNGIAWLAWMHWCFARGGAHA